MDKCGILLPLFSLAGRGGIGTAGDGAKRFLEFLSAAGQDFWQILPLQTADYGGSPYASESAFACDICYIDFDLLVRDGLLDRADVEAFYAECKSDRVERFKDERTALLKKAFCKFEKGKEFENFVEERRNWLRDYALFVALKELHGGKCWVDFDEKYRLRDEKALKEFAEKNAEKLEFVYFGQYLFFRQWRELLDYAHSLNVKIIGDIPIYVSYDSADVWSHGELFMLGKDSRPTLEAGCPPDDFNEDGQLWGNPVYEWTALKNSGYRWWSERFNRAAELYDVVRLDHFRGFESFYAVEAGRADAKEGKWLKGCGRELFDIAKKEFPESEFIAEDLGFVTDGVRRLIEDTGFKNMKVLQFGLCDDADSEHLPKNFGSNCVAYTGTHDNDTARGWYESLSFEKKRLCRKRLKKRPFEKISRAMIRVLYASRAKYVVIPLYDFLNETSAARINTPGLVGKENWSYRLKELPGRELASKIRILKEKHTVKNQNPPFKY